MKEVKATTNPAKLIKVIFEDNHLLVVEKPVNIPTQADISGDPDLLSLLKEDLKIRYAKPGNVYLGLVHRLDRPVGGVMVFAKTSKAASRLSEQIRQHQFGKKYLAVIHGVPAQEEDLLEHYLKKDMTINKVSVFFKPVDQAKHAVLDYKLLQKTADFSLVKINLHTGRSHQIRAQFAAIGHPLFGDQKYGEGYNRPGQQLALWSTEITFKHPVKEEELHFVSLPPSQHPWNYFT